MEKTNRAALSDKLFVKFEKMWEAPTHVSCVARAPFLQPASQKRKILPQFVFTQAYEKQFWQCSCCYLTMKGNSVARQIKRNWHSGEQSNHLF